MPFAGHPTLGAAFVLGAPLQLGVIALETGRGIVPVALERDESGRIVFGRMAQPVPRVEAVEDPRRAPRRARRRAVELPVELYDNGARHIVVTLGAEDELGSARGPTARRSPSSASRASTASPRQRQRPDGGTACSGRTGEDPATGSAAGPIACHLARHGLIAWGEEIVISQGVEIGRPSTLHARADGGDGLSTRVEVGGSAVLVARGEVRI